MKKFTENPSLAISTEYYLKARESENRIYTDAEVSMLPDISSSHLHYKEWLLRKKTALDISRFLREKPQCKSLLDIGCGNGWMSNFLANQGLSVTGTDINVPELEQAQRVFSGAKFVYADIFKENDLEKYDVVLFSASLQYFPDAVETLRFVKRNYLEKNGIIIIADTRFYSYPEIAGAKQRSADYYHKIGTPDMASHYFHHSIDTFRHFKYQVIHKKTIFEFLLSKLKNHPHPFQLFVIS